MAVTYPHLYVKVDERGVAVLTRVEIDGKQVPATRVQFDTGETLDGLVKVKLELAASVEVESDAPLALTGTAVPQSAIDRALGKGS